MTTRRQTPPGVERRVETAEQTAQQAARQTTASVKAGTRTFRQFTKKFYNDWTLHLIQALTYALVTALLPIAILLLGIASNIVGTLSKPLQNQLFGTNGQITRALPAPLNTPEILHSALNKLQSASGLFIIVAIIAALFFGSRLFTLLEECFDIVYRVPQRPAKSKNAVAIVMLVVFVILAPILILASLLPGQFIAILQNLPINTSANVLNTLGGIVSSLIVSFVLFVLMYAFIPNRQGRIEDRLHESWKGALTAAVALQLFLLIFQMYTRYFMNGVVGQVFFALAIIVFFYLLAFAIMVGAEVNAYFAEGIPPASRDLISRVAAEK